MASGYEKISIMKSKLKSKMTVPQLDAALGCGPRTIFRHLQVLAEENCGLRRFKEGGETYYCIQTDAEVSFNQGIVKQLERVKRTLSATEASDIKSSKLLDKVIEAMQTTNPEDFKPEAITTDPDFILDYGPFSDNKLQDTMVNKVLKAIHEGFKIKMHYKHSSASDAPETKEVAPIKVIMRMDTLYLIAIEDDFEQTQIFKNFLFENIDSIQLTNVSFIKPAFDAKVHYKYTFGKYTGNGPVEDVSLEIKAGSKWLQTQFEHAHFNPEITKRYDKNKNMVVDMKIRITPDFITWLMGVSSDVRILKPASLKASVKESLMKALAEIDG